MIHVKRLGRELLTTGLLMIGLFAFRSSLIEPYVVPTGSMEPTILPGDRLFVLKSAYDLKLPFTDISLIHMKEPERGDVIVFKYPVDTSMNYVKRLVGLPGDEIEISDGKIQVNGSPAAITPVEAKALSGSLFVESLGKVQHLVQRMPHRVTMDNILHLKVPADSYFFMGDNRDNSNDSRHWGFVPKSYLKGKALVIWLSLDSTQGWFPSIRWERFGKKLM